jgi:hypothetical protein
LPDTHPECDIQFHVLFEALRMLLFLVWQALFSELD